MMRTSVLTRTVAAVASLAIGSIALAAAPASADAPSGVTRDLIVNAAYPSNYSDYSARKTLISKVCGSTDISNYSVENLGYSDDVDGVLVQAYLDYNSEVEGSGRSCTFAALATAAPYSSLSGTVTISAYTFQESTDLSAAATLSTSFPLSGEVYVTAPITDSNYLFRSYAEASGNVTTVEQATTSSSRVSTPKSTAYKTKALASYKRSIASAQAKLSKALKKAGDSSKKAAARKAYAARKKAAKTTLHIRWSSDKQTVVTTTVGKTTATPFSLTTNNCGRSSSGVSAARC